MLKPLEPEVEQEMKDDLRTSLALSYRTLKKLQKACIDNEQYHVYDEMLLHIIRARKQFEPSEGEANANNTGR